MMGKVKAFVLLCALAASDFFDRLFDKLQRMIGRA